MLTAALIVLFISSAVLVWQGTLPLPLGFAIAAFSLGTLLWREIRAVQGRNGIRRETREKKAKWGGQLLFVSGLSGFTGSRCHLFITRQDELIIDDGTGQRLIPLADVLSFGLFYGESLEKLNDSGIGEMLNLEGVPHFSTVRAWLSHNPKAKKNLMLAVRFLKPLNQLEYSEIAVFSDLTETGNLKAFAARPEIAVKLTFLPRPKTGFGKKRTKKISPKKPSAKTKPEGHGRIRANGKSQANQNHDETKPFAGG